MSIELEKEINKIQRSTKTLFRFLGPLHNKLRAKFRWYYNWHLHPYHRHVHYSVLGISVAIGIISVMLSIFSFSDKIHATGSTVPILASSTATVANTGEKIYFDPAVYNANATIDNYTRQMSGYAWNADLGWIYFGGGSDNSSGPVAADKTGHFSGKAKALNGGYIDFNSSPYGSNVVITSGNFSGYAWSEDLGWINFSGVSAPDYNPDLLAPDNPVVAAKNASGGATLANNTWNNYPHPYFSWTAPNDNANAITPSGVAGYYLYFGDSPSGDPLENSGVVDISGSAAHYQTDLNMTVSGSLVSGKTYYLRTRTKDTSGNTSDAQTVFTYKYDATPPSAPSTISVSPKKYTSANHFTFSWGDSTDTGATDDPATGSNIKNYLYKYNDGGWQETNADQTAAKTIDATDINPILNGENIFYVKAQDNALNASDQVSVVFYYGTTAPDAPTGLVSSPSTSANSPATTNSFRFSWDAPEHYTDIAGYHYSVNAEPTAQNTNTITATSTITDHFAVSVGKNTFYVVAEDTAGNIDYKNFISVDFYCTSAAPAAPTNVQTFDASNRDTQEYAATVKWTKPASIGNNFAGYDVYRSDDGGNNFILAGTVTNADNTIYSETNLYSKEYKYNVKSRDSLGQESAASADSTITPTGKYTDPPKILSGPNVSTTSGTISVNWVTDRASSTFLSIYNENGDEPALASQASAGNDITHSATIKQLSPSTKYRYKVTSTDVDGNTFESDKLAISTAAPSEIFGADVKTAADKLVATWQTSVESNSFVFVSEVDNPDKEATVGSSALFSKNHSVTISGLIPQTKYKYTIKSIDKDGNESETPEATEFSTTQSPAVYVTTTDPSLTSIVLNITSTTNGNFTVFYGPTSEYGKKTEKYSVDATKATSVRLADLTDGTRYYYHVAGTDSVGNSLQNDGYFDTPASPKISDFQLQPIADAPTTTYDVYWKTNVPTSSNVVFSASGKKEKVASKADLEKDHVVRVKDLEDQSVYSVIASGRDQYGNFAAYTASEIKTPLDSRPPKVSNLTTEIKSSGFGTTQKAQIIVSWETDEPSSSQVEYALGIEGPEYSFKTKEDMAFSTNHVVILSELEPSRIYHLRTVSLDGAGNVGYSEDTMTITGKIQSSVLDIIINSLQTSLSWLFGIF